MIPPTTLVLRDNFRLLGTIPPNVLTLDAGFRLLGTIPPALLELDGGFAALGAAPTILVWGADEEWVPVGQRVWTGTGWYVA